MYREKNLTCDVISSLCGFQIHRCTARKENLITGELFGHMKVYYDVVYSDAIVSSFKTLKEAEKFAREYFN